jgi:hypothetical protein
MEEPIDFEFTVEGLTREQADGLLAVITNIVEAMGGTIGGGLVDKTGGSDDGKEA